MTRLFLLPLLLAGLAFTEPPATQPASLTVSPRFSVIDLFIDSHDKALGAYQFEFKATNGQVTVVGIEGADAGPFAKRPPYYDPAAMGHGRAIIAAFSTDAGLPHGRTRVARIHVMIEGPSDPRYAPKLIIAADADGKAIAGASITAQ